MTNNDWLEAGYKVYTTPRLDVNRLADFILQKRFDDEEGKKYYITVYAYDWSKYPPPHNKAGVGYMPTAQFNLGDDKPFFNVEMNGLHSWTGDVSAVEDWFEALWKLFGCPYYEKWEES